MEEKLLKNPSWNNLLSKHIGFKSNGIKKWKRRNEPMSIDFL